jgi:phage terminase large subunit-like protein
MGARRQPLTFAITTAGTYDPDSVGWQKHDYAVKVLEGVFEDDSFFAFIARSTRTTIRSTRRIWGKANPNLGVSVKPDYMRAPGAEKAQRSRASTTSSSGCT